jgi:hypothetical protein
MTATTTCACGAPTYVGAQCRRCYMRGSRQRAAGRLAEGLAEGKLRHGTAYAYVHAGCRCDDCKAAKREYAHSRGDNTRPGVQARKNRWDHEHRPLCDCGQPRARSSDRCSDCRRRDERAALNDKRTEIQRLWAQGAAVAAIAAAVGSTPGSVRVATVQMRKDGWDMPYRYRRR